MPVLSKIMGSATQLIKPVGNCCLWQENPTQANAIWFSKRHLTDTAIVMSQSKLSQSLSGAALWEQHSWIYAEFDTAS